MKKVIFYFAVLLTITSIFVNCSTYILKEYNSIYSFAFVVHGLIFVPFGAMIIQRRNEFKNTLSVKKSGNTYLNAIKTLIPNGNPIVYMFIGICFLYVFINFFITFQYIMDGMAEIIGGEYVLNYKGKITKISKEIYDKHKFYEMRLFSGHWIIFSIIPVFYYYFNDNNKKGII